MLGVTMEKVRVGVHIAGLVQGVYFRYSTQRRAQELGVKGWVRNLMDGSVECLLEGERDTVEDLIRWLHHGPPGARVDHVTTQKEEYRGDSEGFSIRH